MGKEGPRRFRDTAEDNDSSVVTRGEKQPSTRRQREAEVEMKRLMGGAPEVVSTIQANPNIDLEIPQEVVEKDEPWFRPGVIESALMPRVMPRAEKLEADAVSVEVIESPRLSTEEMKRQEEKALGETLGNDIWEELQKHEESKIPEEISQIYGDQTPPSGVLELYKRLNTEKRVEYIKDLRIFEEKNKQQETKDQEEGIHNENLGTETKEPLIQDETKPELAIKWQDGVIPPGRVMPQVVPSGNGSPIQVETKSLDAAPVDEYMELIKNMYKGQPIPPEVQAIYEDIQKSVASKDDVARDVALGKLRGYVAEREEQTEIDKRIAAAHGEPATPEVEKSNRDSIVETLGSKAEFVGEKGTHKKWGDFEDIEHKGTPQTEGTPKEWRDKLRRLIDGAKEKVEGVKQKVEWWKSAEEGLIRRSAELDAQAEKIGGIEKLFRTVGENYNKLGWKTKLAVGAGLGVGMAASSALMFPTALCVCVTGLVAQRTAGLASMYLKFEKESPHGESREKSKWLQWGSKETAMAKAMLYTAGMTAGTMLAVKEMKDVFQSAAVHEWLQQHYPFGHTAVSVEKPPVAPISTPVPHAVVASEVLASAPASSDISQPVMAASAAVPEVPHPPVVAVAGGEAVASSVSPEIPGIEVTATPGHGYEYMMKRLWEDLHAKGIKLPLGANPDSDLARLLEVEKGDEAGINKLVHKLAEENEWFKENGGTSAVIGEHAKMTIDTHGDIWIDHKDIIAPESAPVTPVYHPEVPTVPTAEPLAPLPLVDVASSGPVQPNLSDLVSPYDTSTSVPEAPIPTTPITENIVVNTSGLEVSATQPHLYIGKGDSVIAFGGQKADRLKEMLNYLKSNPDKTIIAADGSEKFRAAWSLVEGKLEQGALIKKPGLFGFLITDSSPSPDDLNKLIK